MYPEFCAATRESTEAGAAPKDAPAAKLRQQTPSSGERYFLCMLVG